MTSRTPTSIGLCAALTLAAWLLVCCAAEQQQPVEPKLVPTSKVAEQQVAAAAAAELTNPSDKLQSGADKKPDEDLFNTDEYVQIKPEELSAELGNNFDPAALGFDASAAAASEQQPQQAAEHKSVVDDELNAHLASADPVASLESAYRPQAASAPAPRVAHPAPPPPRMYSEPPHSRAPRPYHHHQPSSAAAAAAAPHRPLAPASYIKDKLAGINSLVQQHHQYHHHHHHRHHHHHMSRPVGAPAAPPAHSMHPPPPPPRPYGPRGAAPPHGQPQMGGGGARYFPRGAAAGYAAFRDFVRAQANRYKHTAAGPMAHPPPPPPPHPRPVVHQRPAYANEQPALAYGRPQEAPAAAYGASQPPESSYNSRPTRSNVTVAQAYIPHLAPAAVRDPLGAPAANYSPSEGAPPADYQASQMLAKLYGQHAPQGAGKPEYNKDYGMVIHYPQATVYTEPMTMDQLQKLAGSSISQIIEHLQYNLTSGQRDESNLISPHYKHHIGHGMTIHAKEYLAPSKDGKYVPTTAAVISHAAYAGPAAELKLSDELGSGYDRVKAAVAANEAAHHQLPVAGAQSYGGQSAHQQPAAVDYQQQAPESQHPAGSILDSPEIEAQIQSYAKSATGARQLRTPIKMSEHDHRSPLVLSAHGSMADHRPAHQPHRPAAAAAAAAAHGYGGPARRPRGHHHARAPARARPHSTGYAAAHHMSQPPHHPMGAYNQPQPMGHGHAPRGPRAHPARYPAAAAAAYNAQEQGLQQQMAKLLQDFQSSDEQYGLKSQQVINQGYPQKVMQKHQQQQASGAAAAHYEQHEGLEIPHGPNDQVGEISELLEALRGHLESHRPADSSPEYSKQQQQQQQQHNQYQQQPTQPQPGYGQTHQQPQGYSAPAGGATGPQTEQTKQQLEDVRYLASALGQTPSYALQVPVGQPAIEPQHQQQQQPAAKMIEQQQQQVAPSGGYNSYEQQQSLQAAYASAAAGASGAPLVPAEVSPSIVPALSYSGAQEQPAAAPQLAPAAGYGGQAAELAVSVGQQQQQQQTVGSYGDYLQQRPQLAPQLQSISAPDFAVQQHGSAVAAPQQQVGSYQQQQQQQQQSASYEQQQQQQPATGYSVSEHSQVINHLVPVLSQLDQVSQQQQQQLYKVAQELNRTDITRAITAANEYQQQQQHLMQLPSNSQQVSKQINSHTDLQAGASSQSGASAKRTASSCGGRASGRSANCDAADEQEQSQPADVKDESVGAAGQQDEQASGDQRVKVTLEKEPQLGLGITLAGYNCDLEQLSGIFIKSLAAGGAAERAAKVQPMDQIVAINGQELAGYSGQDDVDALMKQAGKSVTLEVVRFNSEAKRKKLQSLLDQTTICGQSALVEVTSSSSSSSSKPTIKRKAGAQAPASKQSTASAASDQQKGSSGARKQDDKLAMLPLEDISYRHHHRG